MNKNEYLKEVEKYLSDLNVMDRAKILSELAESDINLSTNHLELANKKRVEHGHLPYIHKEKVSIFRFLMKMSAVFFGIFLLFITFLIWKFTPVIKVDEPNQRVIILGGLIDIDAKAGKFKIGNDYHFEDASYTNEFQTSLSLDSEIDEIIFDIKSGKVEIKTTDKEQLTVDCKLEAPPMLDSIKKSRDEIVFNFGKIAGSCTLLVPTNRKLSVRSDAASISLIEPEFNSYIELQNGNVSILESPETSYQYDLSIKEGIKDDFNSSVDQDAYEINIKVTNGNILKISE